LYGCLPVSKSLTKIIHEIRQGFNKGLKPKLTQDGTSGVYKLRNMYKKDVAIFKPIDEEAFAPNNPRGTSAPFGSHTHKVGILSGEAAIREVAAYLLDKGHFSGVPYTAFVELVHPSLKGIPFNGLEGMKDEYFQIMQSLIEPSIDRMEEEKKLMKTPESVSSQSKFLEKGVLQQPSLKPGNYSTDTSSSKSKKISNTNMPENNMMPLFQNSISARLASEQ
jgi:hypothetical protein